jgi:hypothetical protein
MKKVLFAICLFSFAFQSFVSLSAETAQDKKDEVQGQEAIAKESKEQEVEIAEPEVLGPNYQKLEAKEVLLEEGTLVKVVLKESVNSATAKEGQKIVAEIKEDVIVDDRVVIRKGSTVKGYVESARRAGGGGTGRISIAVRSVKTVDGVKVSLKAASNNVRAGAYKNAVVGIGPFGVGIPYGSGENTSFTKGYLISTFVEDDVNVHSEITLTPEAAAKISGKNKQVKVQKTTKIKQK